MLENGIVAPEVKRALELQASSEARTEYLIAQRGRIIDVIRALDDSEWFFMGPDSLKAIRLWKKVRAACGFEAQP